MPVIVFKFKSFGDFSVFKVLVSTLYDYCGLICW